MRHESRPRTCKGRYSNVVLEQDGNLCSPLFLQFRFSTLWLVCRNLSGVDIAMPLRALMRITPRKLSASRAISIYEVLVRRLCRSRDQISTSQNQMVHRTIGCNGMTPFSDKSRGIQLRRKPDEQSPHAFRRGHGKIRTRMAGLQRGPALRLLSLPPPVSRYPSRLSCPKPSSTVPIAG